VVWLSSITTISAVVCQGSIIVGKDTITSDDLGVQFDSEMSISDMFHAPLSSASGQVSAQSDVT